MSLHDIQGWQFSDSKAGWSSFLTTQASFSVRLVHTECNALSVIVCDHEFVLNCFVMPMYIISFTRIIYLFTGSVGQINWKAKLQEARRHKVARESHNS